MDIVFVSKLGTILSSETYRHLPSRLEVESVLLSEMSKFGNLHRWEQIGIANLVRWFPNPDVKRSFCRNGTELLLETNDWAFVLSTLAKTSIWTLPSKVFQRLEDRIPLLNQTELMDALFYLTQASSAVYSSKPCMLFKQIKHLQREALNMVI